MGHRDAGRAGKRRRIMGGTQQEEQKQIESNLQLLGAAETTAAVDFRNQLSTAQLLLEIETGDASFRLDQLSEFLRGNF
jgi:hypothetical protein